MNALKAEMTTLENLKLLSANSRLMTQANSDDSQRSNAKNVRTRILIIY